MGPLGKYAAYRWVSSGNSNGGGGGLAVVAIIFAILFGLAFLVNFLVMGITDIVFTYIRPIFLVSPTLITAAVALPVVATLSLIPKYSPETAKEILAPNGTSTWFYAKAVLVVGFLNFYMYDQVTDVLSTLDLPGIPGLQLLGVVWMFAILYWTYKLFHLPYRFHRLLQHAPSGYLYSVIAMLPLVTTVIATILQIPVYSGSDVLYVVAVNSSFALALLFMKFGAEPHIVNATGSDGSNRSKPPAYQ